MPNIRLQDVTAIINGTSQYNSNAFDTCHVEMLLVTDEAIPPETGWYVPLQNGSTVPPIIMEIFKLSNLQMYPQNESTITKGVEDAKEQALAGNTQGVFDDMSKLLLISLLKKMSLVPVNGSTNTYMLQYDYKLFPIKDVQIPTYQFYVQLPFDTLTLVTGGRIQCTVLTPINSIIDSESTKGTIFNNGTPSGNIEEQTTRAEASKRPVVSFEYQNDPLFVVQYHY